MRFRNILRFEALVAATALAFAAIQAQDAVLPNEPHGNATTFVFQEGPSQKEQARKYLDHGLKAMGDKIYNIAEDFFKEYRKSVEPHEPDFAVASTNLAQALIGQDKLKEAEEALLYHQANSAGLKSSQDQAKLNYVWAQICFKQGRYDDCLKFAIPLTLKDSDQAFIEKATIIVADAYAQKKDWNGVKETLVNFILIPEIGPNNFEIQKRLVNVHLCTGNPQAAEAVLAKITSIAKPEDQLAINLLKIHCFAKLKRDEDALTVYQNIAAQCPEKPDMEWWNPLWELSQILFEKQRFPELEPILTQTAKTACNQQDEVAATILLAKTQIELKKNNLAQNNLDIVRKKFPDYPQLDDVTFRLAQLHQHTHSHRTAAELFSTLVENQKIDPLMRTEAAFSKATSLFADGQWNKAIETYIAIEPIAPTQQLKAKAIFHAAELAEKNKQEQQAVELYDKLADSYPQSDLAPEARMRQGNALMQQNEYEKAAETYKQFAETFPKHEYAQQANLQQGVALRLAAVSNEDKSKAAKFLDQAAATTQNPEYAALALLEAFKAARDSGDLKFALQLLDKLIERFPESTYFPQALYQRVLVKLRQNLNQSAIEDADLFFKQFPLNPLAAELYIIIADLHASQNEWSLAQNRYLSLKAAFPNSKLQALAIYEAANCAYKLNEYEGALGILKEIDKPIPEGQQEQKLSQEEKQFKAKSLMLKGEILASMNDYASARQAYAEVMKTIETSDLTYAALGRQGDMCLALAAADNTKVSNQELLQNAVQCFNQILDEKSTASHELKEMATYRLAICLERQGKPNEALDIFLKICYAYTGSPNLNGVKKPSFYFEKSVFDAARLLQQDGTPENLRKAMHLYRDLVNEQLPTSKQASLKYEEIRKKHGFDK
ncbi:MAG: tetratricopeptide repeat protein [Lentisphaerae bacterium]|jgi:tetratricopeptide (TPR) repeat protein|nr:tetratricopeptide repeat protein [Lentisphaerota bacterium]